MNDKLQDLLGRTTFEMKWESAVIKPPDGMGKYEFSVLASQRVAQLMRGALPRVDSEHKMTVVAQLEVSAGKVKDLRVTPGMSDAAELAAGRDGLHGQPACPICNSTDVTSHETADSGVASSWQCQACGRTWSPDGELQAFAGVQR